MFANIRESNYVFRFKSEPFVELLLVLEPAVKHLFKLVRVLRVIVIDNEKFRGAARLYLLQTLFHAVLCATYLVCVGRRVTYQIHEAAHIKTLCSQ